MRTTLKDIAQSLDISKSAISRYLNNDPKLRLSPETKKRIDAAVKKVNYRPSQIACSFRNGRTNMIGMTLSGITDNFSSHLAEACIYFCEKKNYQLLLALSSLNIEKEHQIILNFLDRRVDGIIIAGAIPDPGSPIDRELNSSGIKVVAFNHYSDSYSSVTLDRDHGCAAMLDFYKNGGHDSVFFGGYIDDGKLEKSLQELACARGMDMETCNIEMGTEYTLLIETIMRKRPQAIYLRDCKMAKALQKTLKTGSGGYTPEIVTGYNLKKDDIDSDYIAGFIFEKFYERIDHAMKILFADIEEENTGIRNIVVPACFYSADEFYSRRDELADTVEKYDRMNPSIQASAAVKFE